MSLLNQSGEEQADCPLCMEPLEVDDLTFFPCTCGYQICRFCWHRIRTDGNGLCPACRQPYSEDPADFIPLSQEQIAKLKAEKRQKDQQRKAKLNESRKHLASVRVVQRNLVFVVGLPMRLADPEVLKKHEYFGKFGKIHKVVINQSTSYAGSQGPSASAYVTYMKSDDALRAIQSVNNITIDGRQIKSSLGTTKYCSHFMKNQPCPKPDCMYLHDYGDPEASFTKEQMHAGKHQEYEKKLHDVLVQRSATTPTTTTLNTTINNNNNNNNDSKARNKEQTSGNGTATTNGGGSSTSGAAAAPGNSGTNKDTWPQLDKDQVTVGKSTTDQQKEIKKLEKDSTNKTKSTSVTSKNGKKEMCNNKKISGTGTSKCDDSATTVRQEEKKKISLSASSLLDDNSSFFSHNFQKIPLDGSGAALMGGDMSSSLLSPHHRADMMADTLPDLNTIEDWAAAFGFNAAPSQDTFRGRAQFNEEFCNLFDIAKIQENILEALPPGKQLQQQPGGATTSENYYKESGLDQPMSKFFQDFQQKNGYTNGYINHHHHHPNNLNMDSERLLVMQQKKLEEQLVNLSMRQGYGGGASMATPINGDFENNGFGGYHQMAPAQPQKTRTLHAEDELDFDPFQETQKAFAELMASETNSYKTHNGAVRRSGNSANIGGGVVGGSHHHSQHQLYNGMLGGGASGKGGASLPPPPPGFMQPNTHMNSFGSKILPFLNMSNSQQASPNNWPNYSPQQQMQPTQHKSLNGCNDWKDFDSAIVTTARHYPLNFPPTREQHHFGGGGSSSPQQQQRPPREFTQTNAFSNFTQQLQSPPPGAAPAAGSSASSFNNFAATSTATQQNHHHHNMNNWFTRELSSQISSPPGFRNTNQTTKQQEC